MAIQDVAGYEASAAGRAGCPGALLARSLYEMRAYEEPSA
jgi:hypothetical protein